MLKLWDNVLIGRWNMRWKCVIFRYWCGAKYRQPMNAAYSLKTHLCFNFFPPLTVFFFFLSSIACPSRLWWSVFVDTVRFDLATHQLLAHIKQFWYRVSCVGALWHVGRRMRVAILLASICRRCHRRQPRRSHARCALRGAWKQQVQWTRTTWCARSDAFWTTITATTSSANDSCSCVHTRATPVRATPLSSGKWKSASCRGCRWMAYGLSVSPELQLGLKTSRQKLLTNYSYRCLLCVGVTNECTGAVGLYTALTADSDLNPNLSLLLQKQHTFQPEAYIRQMVSDFKHVSNLLSLKGW